MRSALLVTLLLALPMTAAAQALPRLVLIIDDIGDNLPLGRRAVDLPGAVTVAILPHTTYSAQLAERAAKQGKVVMLHAPMSSHAGYRTGPGTLSVGMDRQRFLQVLRENLAAVPQARGVNNHMGSALTERPLPMSWLMDELRQRELFFVDSRTTRFTVAEAQARAHGLPHLRRHVFLDHSRNPAAIQFQFERWLRLARQQGLAVAIGHPYPETLALLEQRLPGLLLQGLTLVSAADAARPAVNQAPGPTITSDRISSLSLLLPVPGGKHR